MILCERDWKYGIKVKYYSDIEAELLNFEKGIQVLPAPFFHEKHINFTLLERYEAEDKKPGFPEGGFELRGPDGEIRSFNLDQVIVHPYVVKHVDTIKKMSESPDGQKRRGRKSKLKELGLEEKPKGTGKRGRKPLPPEEKAKREAEKIEKAARSNGRRGRPKMSEEEKQKRIENIKPKETTGRRGRPSLTEEEKAKREAAKAAITKKSGGKRGRPSKSRS